MNNRRRSIGVAALALTQLCAGPAPLQLFEAVEPHMGTLVQIKVYAASEEQAQAAMRQAFDRIASLDDTLSDYKPDSELNRVCRTALDHPVEVSRDLFRVLAASQRLAEESDGAFDITVGPLTHLWRQARQSHHLPDEQALREASSHCGYRKLQLDAAQQTAKLAEPGMQLDVGGIGKGYAADEAIAVLAAQNIQSALVSVSGDLAFSDAPPGQPGWRIGIASFSKAGAPQMRVLLLKDGAASTSGDSEQHLDVGTVRYSHIIDPHTGRALTQRMTVTVLSRNGLDADGLATAVTVLGADRGLTLIQKYANSAAFIVEKNRGGVDVKESSRFRLFTPAS